jgi:uncharacterized lipoprotein YmbA
MPITSTTSKLCCLALVMAALGCGTSAPSRFYALSPITADTEALSSDAVLTVGPWILPEYLDRPQIVTRSAGAELELAEFHRWAEPLKDNFSRVLAMNLSALLDSSHVHELSRESQQRADLFVGGRVYRFDVDESGLAVLDVQWTVKDGGQQLVHGPMRSRYQEQSANKRNHDAGVQALSQTLGRFSRDIAAVVRGSSD